MAETTLKKINPILAFIAEIFKKAFYLVKSVITFILALFLIFFILAIFSSILIVKEGGDKFYTGEKILKTEGIAETQNKIVVQKITGTVSLNGGADLFYGGESITPAIFENTFANIKKDSQVKAVIFDIDSPGGSPVASDRIFELIQDFKKETQIPVIFLMGDLAASGGYYIAAASDYIVANPSTLTGSIGTIMESYNFEGLYEKLGIQKNTFKTGEYKDILSDSRPITEQELKIIQDLNTNTYDLFVQRVSEGRKLPVEFVKSIANGQIYSGRQAKDLDLVDSLGNLDEAVYQAKSLANIQDFKVVEYQSNSFFSQFMSQIKTNFSPLTLLYKPATIYTQR